MVFLHCVILALAIVVVRLWRCLIETRSELTVLKGWLRTLGWLVEESERNGERIVAVRRMEGGGE